jgi:hypothetical protein
MNLHTFGNSDSARTLAEILDRDDRIKRKVSSRIVEFNQVQNEILYSNLSLKLKKSFLQVTLERFQKKLKRFDGEVQTFSLNILSQQHRTRLKSL